jgi:curved DNA-binding protein CbpA
MSGQHVNESTSDADPYVVLGVSRDAGDTEIRTAYLEGVRRHPPDRSPAAFERIRDAYESLRDPIRRARLWLFLVDPFAPLERLVEEVPAERRRPGPGPWLSRIRQALLPDGRQEPQD